LERLVLGGLARGGERRERATVERTEHRHNPVARTTAELAGEFDRRLVRLGTGIAEEHLSPAAEQFVDHDGGACGDRVGEEVAHVQETLRLVGDRTGDTGMRVAE